MYSHRLSDPQPCCYICTYFVCAVAFAVAIDADNTIRPSNTTPNTPQQDASMDSVDADADAHARVTVGPNSQTHPSPEPQPNFVSETHAAP